jgi:hypothetical protein
VGLRLKNIAPKARGCTLNQARAICRVLGSFFVRKSKGDNLTGRIAGLFAIDG